MNDIIYLFLFMQIKFDDIKNVFNKYQFKMYFLIININTKQVTNARIILCRFGGGDIRTKNRSVKCDFMGKKYFDKIYYFSKHLISVLSIFVKNRFVAIL